MKKRTAPRLVVAFFVAAGGATAAEPPQALHLRTAAQYPAPLLQDVGAREYKFLIDPATVKGPPEEAFRAIWAKIKTAATKRGFDVTEKKKHPFRVENATKEYFDTPTQALWSNGYLVRVTTKSTDGKPDSSANVTVKSNRADARATLAAPLAVVATASKTEAEGNVGLAAGGGLVEIVEKGSSFRVAVASLGARTLGDFGKYVPELLALGLPATTPLAAAKAWSSSVHPGDVVLAGTPCKIAMEGWSLREGEAPVLYDLAYRCSAPDFYAAGAAHAAGERFFFEVVMGELSGLASPDDAKWAGSKVRKLLNRPVSAPRP
jgi:hypothetical protein